VTPAEIVTQVRRLILDTVTPYRYDDTMLLGFVNQTIRRMAIMRPDMFTTIADITLTQNAVLQSLPSSGVRFVAAYSVTRGSTTVAVTETTKETLDRAVPSWIGAAAASPVNYMRHPRNPDKFFVYPRPLANTTMSCEYVDTPPNYALGDTIGFIPDLYFPTLVAGVVALAQSVDDEHVNSGRSKLFDDIFMRDLGTDSSNRAIIDNENAGVPTAVKRPIRGGE
jgi:hypothetical protein